MEYSLDLLQFFLTFSQRLPMFAVDQNFFRIFTHEGWRFPVCSPDEMTQVFGRHTVNYIFDLMNGKIDFLVRMPTPVLMKIASFLPLEDIARLSHVCRKLRHVSFGNFLTLEFQAGQICRHAEHNTNEPLAPAYPIILNSRFGLWKKLIFVLMDMWI